MGEERITEMAQLSDLEYLRLSKGSKFLYKLGRFFTGIPRAVGNVFLKLCTLPDSKLGENDYWLDNGVVCRR